MTKQRIFIQSNIIGTVPARYPEKCDYERSDDTLLEDPSFPKLFFIENLYNADPTNWWLPNFTGFEAMVRSAGLKIINRPHPHVIVAEPDTYFGKVVLPKLVFPRYGKKRGAIFPGPQEYDLSLWQELIRRSKEADR
ncbi:MAG: hypothetical protein DMG05_09915 [Acidobacteria bacterium]|nr:MAG: hypothetical protein DMG05_09915 [Acidobacteriota bacterium]